MVANDHKRADSAVSCDSLPFNTRRHSSQVSATATRMLPVILILGPPGSGKGTICKQLSADFSLHHLSVGDWLRDQAKPPIASVPEHINRYVAEGAVVPEDVLEAEYGPGKEENAPAPLTLYQSSKRNVSTPESMKCRLMPTLKAEIEALSTKVWREGRWRWRGSTHAVLLDNLTSTLAHAAAAAETFGAQFPTMAIAVDCSDETAEARFLARGRGSDDAARFRRRIARYRKGSADVLAFLREKGTAVVEVSTEGEPETVYENLLGALAEDDVWSAIVAADEKHSGELNVGIQQPFAETRTEVSVES